MIGTLKKKSVWFGYGKRLAAEIGRLPIFWLGVLSRRQPELWVFGSWEGKRYADNSKYLFEYVNRCMSEVRPVWVSRNRSVVEAVRAKGYESHYFWSLKGAASTLRASVCVVTHGAQDVNSAFTRGALLANLTHGTPLKRIRRDAQSRRLGALTSTFDRFVKPFLPDNRRIDVFYVASDAARAKFVSAFGADPETVQATGYPRWVAFNSDSKPDGAELCDELNNYGRVILYAPTQRRQGKESLSLGGIPGFKDFLEWLEQTNSLMFVRPHDALVIDDDAKAAREAKGRIRQIGTDLLGDINELLPHVDILITDYSSIIYDFAVLRKPFVMLAYDLNDFSVHDVGLYGDYTSEFAGRIAATWTDVSELIDRNGATSMQEYLAGFTEKHGLLFDGSEAEKIANDLRRRSSPSGFQGVE